MRKVLLTFLSLLFVCSTTGAVIGYKKNQERNKPIEEPIKKEITINYYLEDVLVEEMPSKKIDDTEILFDKFSCTNDINGAFDEEKWIFTTNENVEGTCKLYFVKSKYKITITPSNAVSDENNPQYINRNENGSFIVTPNEGYKYADVICSNNKEAHWDESTNTLSINSITSDIACTMNFDRKELKIDVIVKNGAGNTTEKVLYGEDKRILIEPSGPEWTNPTIKCTNSKKEPIEAISGTNSFSLVKVTDNISCNVTYNKKIVKYKFEIKEPIPESINIVDGALVQEIIEGKDGTIAFTSEDENTLPKLICKDDKNQSVLATSEPNGNQTKFTLYNFSKNITCTVSTEQKVSN